MLENLTLKLNKIKTQNLNKKKGSLFLIFFQNQIGLNHDANKITMPIDKY